MDAISLATLTSGITMLAVECIKGVANSAGQDLWAEIKALVGWEDDPSIGDLASNLAQALNENEKLAAKIAKRMQSSASDALPLQLVANLNADGGKVIVSKTINIHGNLNM